MFSRLSLRTAAHTSRASISRSFSTTDISGKNSKVCAVLGAQWGDEGKGKLADVLAAEYDIVARFNGGDNAGHTLVVDGKKYAFHLLPCGLVYPHTTNFLGNGVVVNVKSLFAELAPLNEGGICTKGRLKVSNRAHLLFDFHQLVDGIQEEKRGKGGIGTTKKGIGPAYTSKATRNGIRVAQLKDWDSFEKSYRALAEAHETMYQVQVDKEGELERLKEYRARMLEDDMIVDGVHFINEAYSQGKKILAEGANACMLDIDYGTYPYVTSSSTTNGGIGTGLGIAPQKIESVIGVVKAYTTRVGSGPFPTELTDDLCGGDLPRGAPGTEIGRHLQEVGAEIGVTTGRKRRCGWFDAALMKYSHMINGYTSMNITKLDVLDDLDEVKIAVAYKNKETGEVLPDGSMPATLEELSAVEPVYETLPGWKTDITNASSFSELPIQAQNYINRIEELVSCKVSYIGVGAKREQMVTKGF
mmetsp:Transcript_16471/g.19993  ORF Transcript_16471/g.19993 Transcript_16471/m.19993 type:complete len:473 (+) Transcript_16471:56-1474(+)